MVHTWEMGRGPILCSLMAGDFVIFEVNTQRQVKGEETGAKRSEATPLDEDRKDEMLSVVEVDLKFNWTILR